MAAERWINAGFPPTSGTSSDVARQLISDLLFLGYKGVRISVPLYSNNLGSGYAFAYNPTDRNTALLYSQLDAVASSGLKRLIILAYGPRNFKNMGETGTWVDLNGGTRWDPYTRPVAGTLFAVWAAMVVAYNDLINYAILRWESFGRNKDDLRFEWWNEPFTIVDINGNSITGVGGSLPPGGVDTAFQQTSQYIVPRLNLQGCRFYGPNFNSNDPSNPFNTGTPLYETYMHDLENGMGTYPYPTYFTDWALNIYPEPVVRPQGGPAYFADLIGGMADRMISILRGRSYCFNKRIHLTEYGARGNWISQGGGIATYRGNNQNNAACVIGAAYNADERGQIVAALEQRLQSSDLDSICLYTLADTESESSGRKHSLRDYTANYALAYKYIAAGMGLVLPFQPTTAMPWPAAHPPAYDPIGFGNNPDPMHPPDDLLMFLEAWGSCLNSLGGQCTDGQGVATWVDRTLNLRNATQAGASQPVFHTNQFGTLPGIVNSSSQFLNLTAFGLGDFHVFVLGTFTDNSVTLGTSATSAQQISQRPGGANTLRFSTNPVLPGQPYNSDAAPITLSAYPTVIEVSRQGTQLFFWQDGIPIGYQTGVSNTTIAWNRLFQLVGVTPGTQTTGAILVFSRGLAAYERFLVIDYLRRKVGF